MGLFDRLQSEIEGREKAAGLSIADMLVLPEPLQKLLSWMMRQREVTLSELAAHVKEEPEAARGFVAELVEKGFVRELQLPDEPRYRVRLAAKRTRDLPADLWGALDQKVDEEQNEE